MYQISRSINQNQKMRECIVIYCYKFQIIRFKSYICIINGFCTFGKLAKLGSGNIQSACNEVKKTLFESNVVVFDDGFT